MHPLALTRYQLGMFAGQLFQLILMLDMKLGFGATPVFLTRARHTSEARVLPAPGIRVVRSCGGVSNWRMDATQTA